MNSNKININPLPGPESGRYPIKYSKISSISLYLKSSFDISSTISVPIVELKITNLSNADIININM